MEFPWVKRCFIRNFQGKVTNLKIPVFSKKYVFNLPCLVAFLNSPLYVLLRANHKVNAVCFSSFHNGCQSHSTQVCSVQSVKSVKICENNKLIKLKLAAPLQSDLWKHLKIIKYILKLKLAISRTHLFLIDHVSALSFN